MMDRPGHDYPPSASMAFAQQQQQAGNIQQQFGFHPQHQQFSPIPGRPFLPPHPSVQQHPFHHHVQHQAPQLLPHSSVPHLMHPHPQQQAPPPFFPQVPPHIVPPPFMGSYDSGPLPVAPPPDPELHKRIDKLVEYSAKNGPEFEAMIREKQQENPAYSFLFGGEGYAYYRHKLWISTRATGPFNPALSPSMPMMHHPPNPIINSSLNAPFNCGGVAMGPSAPMAGLSQMHPNSSPYFEPQPHQYSQPFGSHGLLEFDNSTKPFKGLSGPLPSDVAIELNDVLNNLTGTKESIKGAKIWFMQRSPFAPALAEALRDRFFTLDDSERQLHIIYLANDILFDSLQRRLNLHDLDNEAFAFKPILGCMLARVYHNPQNRQENQSRLQKILQFWASKEVYGYDTIRALETEMIGRTPSNSFATPLERVSVDHSSISGMPSQTENHNNVAPRQMGMEAAPPILVDQDNRDKQLPPGNVATPIVTAPQCAPGSTPTSAFAGPVSMPSSAPQAQLQSHGQAAASSGALDNVPPYPLFPPGLIPGMVRKMQIGSGVPYSPMSPLDIPTIIPPSNITPTEVSEKVSKFFKEIGEADPSGRHIKASDVYDNYDKEPPVRKGGACIPPPPNLQADQEADGTLGSSSSGRLGLGASANPNDASQYDDVYTSYRKQRSTTYYSSLQISLH